MKKMFSAMTLILGFLIASTSALSQTWKQSSPDFASLSLEISTNKSAYLPLEPIAITFKITNNTNQQVLAHSTFGFANRYVKLSVRRSGSSFREIENLSPLIAQSYIKPAYLQPGQQWQSTELLNHELRTSFGEPGGYELMATFGVHRGNEVVVSSPITIEINQPTGDNLEAYRFLKTRTAGKAFFSNLKDHSVLEEFIAEHRESAYGDFAVYFLGIRSFYQHDYEKAQINFEYLSDRKDFPLLKEVKDSLNEWKYRLLVRDHR